MLNLPIKILKTIQIPADQAGIEFDTIAELVADWDDRKHVVSRHLVLIVNAADDRALDQAFLRMRFNGSVAAVYHQQLISGQGAADVGWQLNAQATIPVMAYLPGANYANAFGGSIILIPHAFNAVNHKVVLALGGAVEVFIEATVARWAGTAALNTVRLYSDSNLIAGSTISLGVIDERYRVGDEILLAADGTPTWDNIPQGEGDLVVIGYARSDQAAVEDEVLHYINDDATAANYPAQQLDARDAVTNAEQINQECAMISGDNATALAFGAFVEVWSQYTKDNQPHFLTQSGYHETSGPTAEVRLMSGRRANIEPINKLHYEPNAGTDFKAGSLFSLYRVPKRIIERQILTAPQAVITFDNIPQNFEALILHVYARTDEGAVDDEIAITINADAVAVNYDWQELTGAAAAVAAVRNAASQQLMYVPGDNEGTGEFGGGSALFPGYAKTDRHKHILVFDGQQENRVAISSQRWESMVAIVTIALAPVTGANFLAGTIVELEGVMRREGLPPSEGEQWGV